MIIWNQNHSALKVWPLLRAFLGDNLTPSPWPWNDLKPSVKQGMDCSGEKRGKAKEFKSHGKEETTTLLAADRTVSLQSHRKFLKATTSQGSLRWTLAEQKIQKSIIFIDSSKGRCRILCIKVPSRRTTKTGLRLQTEQKEKLKTSLKKTVKLYWKS